MTSATVHLQKQLSLTQNSCTGIKLHFFPMTDISLFTEFKKNLKFLSYNHDIQCNILVPLDVFHAVNNL